MCRARFENHPFDISKHEVVRDRFEVERSILSESRRMDHALIYPCV